MTIVNNGMMIPIGKMLSAGALTFVAALATDHSNPSGLEDAK